MNDHLSKLHIEAWNYIAEGRSNTKYVNDSIGSYEGLVLDGA